MLSAEIQILAQANKRGRSGGRLALKSKIDESRSHSGSSLTTVPNILLFTQPGCLSCELMRIYLEAREIAFVEHDITIAENRRTMTDTHGSNETPTLVIDGEVIPGFDPALLDQLLDPAPSSDSVPES